VAKGSRAHEKIQRGLEVKRTGRQVFESSRLEMDNPFPGYSSASGHTAISLPFGSVK
jgi:hypothetical protein